MKMKVMNACGYVGRVALMEVGASKAVEEWLVEVCFMGRSRDVEVALPNLQGSTKGFRPPRLS